MRSGMKNRMGTRLHTLARGYRIRYAPSTPAIAPDAPISGAVGAELARDGRLRGGGEQQNDQVDRDDPVSDPGCPTHGVDVVDGDDHSSSLPCNRPVRTGNHGPPTAGYAGLVGRDADRQHAPAPM